MWFGIHYFNLTKIFINDNIKQNAPGLNRDLSAMFWWLKRVNHVKFTFDVYKESFSQKIFTNRLNFQQQAWVEKTVHREKSQSIVKKNVPRVAVSKEDYTWQASVTWKDPSLLISLVRIISTSCCQCLRQKSPHLLNNQRIYIYIYIYIYCHLCDCFWFCFFFFLICPCLWFGLVSLFNGISTFVGHLMPKPSI